MPVQKYRSIEEMKESTTSYEPGSAALQRAIGELWRASAAMCPVRFPPGVYKHRSIADAARLSQAWDEENFRRRRERLRQSGGNATEATDS